ncbi:MAG TPA: SDR family oxidoreductase [Steroidobacteraceae bacterium]|jgi:NAD(P)-dependent dehydrogenase (short-subunit alcohol dehydrogenase family)|nr:SDR family oxidoreductase [Steroidobacteraceae bacterium]
MKIDCSGQTAIVTGSTSGIGFAIATALARAGAVVVLNGRSSAAVDAALQGLRKAVAGVQARGVAENLSTADGCAALVKAVPDTDILINNVGIYGPKDFFAVTDQEWQQYFDINVMSGVRLSRAYLSGMLKRNRGRIVFISSESGLNIPADMLAYGFSKTAQLSIARGLAKLTRGSAVTVNSVLPGPTLSDGVVTMLRDAAKQQGKTIEQVADEFVRTQRPSSIIARAATPEEVANMVVYVASPLSSATNGAALRVEGGVVDTIS